MIRVERFLTSDWFRRNIWRRPGRTAGLAVVVALLGVMGWMAWPCTSGCPTTSAAPEAAPSPAAPCDKAARADARDLPVANARARIGVHPHDRVAEANRVVVPTGIQARMARLEMTRLSRHVDAYWRQHDRRLPRTLGEAHGGGVGQALTVDPWNNPYAYEIVRDNEFRLRSAGPDGQLKTRDDVTLEWLLSGR